MLYFIAAWSILATLAWIVGTALIQGLNADCFDRVGDRVMVALWLGTVLLSQGLLLIAIALPLSPMVGLGIALALLLLLTWPPMRVEFRKIRQTISCSVLFGLIGWGILIAAYTSQRNNWFDTGLYHYGAIRWLSEFGTVPGLALILSNFGFTSTWFALAAPFNPAAIASQTSVVTNGFILLVATGHGLIALHRWMSGRARVTDKFIVIASVLILPAITLTTFLSAILISSSPDIPVIFLTVAVAWSILTVANPALPRQGNANSVPFHKPLWDASLIPLILAVGAISIKLSALPLLPIAGLFYWGQQPQNLRRLLVGGGLSILLLVPFTAAGIIHSGCPLYPSSALCIDLPWRVSETTASEAAKVVQLWEHALGSPPSGTNALLWRLWEWLKFARLNVIMLLLLILSVALTGFTYKAARRQGILGTPWLFCLGLIGMVFILFQAPMIRFGLGYFTLIPTIAIAILGIPCAQKVDQWRLQPSFPRLPTNRRLKIFWFGLGILGAIYLTSTNLRERWLLPPMMPTTAVETQQSFDIAYVKPINDRRGQCWDAPIPCSPNNLDVRLRNPNRGFKAGFIPAKNSDPGLE